MMIIREKQKNAEKNLLQCQGSTKNPTSSHQGLNLGLHDGKPCRERPFDGILR
jgi:hypothetical protein